MVLGSGGGGGTQIDLAFSCGDSKGRMNYMLLDPHGNYS